MEKDLKIVFSREKTQLVMRIGDTSAGPFTLIENVLKQLSEFYKDNLILQKDLCRDLDIIIASANLKTKIDGYFSVFFILHELFPFYYQKSNDHLSDSIFLVRVDHGYKRFFGISAGNNNWNVISGFFFYKYEAYKFLNFMLARNIITQEKFDFLNEEINKTNMYYARRISTYN
jgi:hypothetical protein